MATQQEVMKAFMKSLDETELSGRAALDEAIQASSSFDSYQEVIEKFYTDWKATDNWHRFLVEKCGIVLDNKDTGAISGSDAGGATAKGADYIIPSKGEAKYPEGSSFTVDGLTIYGIPPKEELTEDQQYIVQGLYSWWIRDALALIKESYGLTFTDENTTNSRMKLEFIEVASGLLAAVSPDTQAGKVLESRNLMINMTDFKNMSWDNRQGVVVIFDDTTEVRLDRTLVHELTHGIMVSNINYFGNLPLPIIEGGTAEIIHGVDDERYNSIITCAKDEETFKKIVKYLSPSSAGLNMSTIPYEGGYIFMRYFLKQAADTTFDYDTYQKKVNVDSDSFATNYFDKVKMLGSNDADTITNSGEKVLINGKNGADLIKNYSADVTIKTGSGNDTISNEGSNVKITSGAGNDSILNTGSNVKITSGAGNDSILNTGSDVKIDTGAGTDFIVNVGSNVKITSGAGSESIENSGSDVKIDAGAGDDLIVNDASNVKINAGAGSDNISVYSGTSNVSVYGGAGADSIMNYGASSVIYGDKGNDIIINGSVNSAADSDSSSDETEESTLGINSTIHGGAGTDSITNYSGWTFIYGDAGKDYIENNGTFASIYGGANNDSIKNFSENTAIYGDAGNDFIINKGTLVSIYGGAGNDSIENLNENPAINDEDDDLINNINKKSFIYGGAGNDNFINRGDRVYIDCGADNDSIYNSGANVSLYGGEGNDSLYNEGAVIEISGGAGNDSIYNAGDHVSISGDAGNDYIENDGGKHINYNFGEGFGNDTVVGFNTNDTIQITSGGYSAVASGDDVLVSVGDSSLLLKDAASMEINFISAAGETELWFAEEDNFATTANLNAIVKNNSPATYLDNTDYKNLAQENDLIIYPNVGKT